MSSPLIFYTLHGSRLYGLDHEDSDEDWYFVSEGTGRKLHQETD